MHLAFLSCCCRAAHSPALTWNKKTFSFHFYWISKNFWEYHRKGWHSLEFFKGRRRTDAAAMRAIWGNNSTNRLARGSIFFWKEPTTILNSQIPTTQAASLSRWEASKAIGGLISYLTHTRVNETKQHQAITTRLTNILDYPGLV